MESLILVANPGSASRKYALFEGKTLRAQLHFEYVDGRVMCTLQQDGEPRNLDVGVKNIETAAEHVLQIFRQQGALRNDEQISRIGLRIVAPSSFFLQDHVMDDEVVGKLKDLAEHAPIHITATLAELTQLQQQFPDAPIVGVSDSAFHITKPDHAWNYGLPLDDADRLEIKRFGYHGISVASVINTLHQAEKLPPKVIVAHLGSGVSVTAVLHGKSIDTTMGYSPLEGVIMSTRAGSIDPTAVRAIKTALQLDDAGVEEYLNTKSGLLGLGGSGDIRELLQREADGDHRAALALATYVYSVQKAIGQMAATLGGVDALVFTGTVGERSAQIRQRVMHGMLYLDLEIDEATNNECYAPNKLTIVSRLAKSKPIFVVPAREAVYIAKHAQIS